MTEATITGEELGVQAWTTTGDHDLCAENFVPVATNKRGVWCKPDAGTGLWTSTWHPDQGSDWIQWCLSEEFGASRDNPEFRIWTLTPDPDARIYRIDAYEELAALVTAYPAVDHRLGPLARSFPDWVSVAEDFDAVHLTEEGQWATRLSDPFNLYGWDCESTLWLRWAFLGVADLGTVRCSYKWDD